MNCQCCGGRVNGGLLCTRHLADVRVGLERIPEVRQQLRETWARQAKLADQTKVTGSRETALPYVPSAADLLDRLDGHVNSWADTAWELRIGAARPTDPDGRALWLADHLGELRNQTVIVYMHETLASLLRAADRLCDRRDPDLFLGLCEAVDVQADLIGDFIRITVGTCGASLYGDIELPRVTCEKCGQVYSARRLRESVLERAADHLAPPEVVAELLTRMGTPLTTRRVKAWIARGRLQATHGWCRVGDVTRLAVTRHERP